MTTSTLISEKVAEILFNRFMLQCFGLGKAELFAPTSPEEFACGYDGKVVGFGRKRELYLQFKAPSFSARDGRFRAELTDHQHRRLLDYPRGSAWYVAGMFPSMQQFNQAQAEAKTAEDFLKHFICIDAAAMPPAARSFTFDVPESHRHSPQPGFKAPGNGPGPRDCEVIAQAHWDRGSGLVAKLKAGTVGRVLTFKPERAVADAEAIASLRVRGAGLPSKSDCMSMGTFVRVPTNR